MSDDVADDCDTDDDNDGLTDVEEWCSGAPTDPRNRDADGDHALDGAECILGTDAADGAAEPALASCGLMVDSDADGIADFREVCYYNTDPGATDSDGDGYEDGCEVYSINADRVVNVLDLQQIALEQTTYLSPGYPVQVNFDVTKNGSIDVVDLQQTAASAPRCA
jgi:hypothetical protein